MTKQEVVLDAQKYANTICQIVYVLRRGKQYKSSRNEYLGWVIVELVKPNLKELA